MLIDHIGVVVKDIQKGIAHWSDAFGYTQKTQVVINSRQKVKVVFLRKTNSTDVKLIEPTDSDSTVFRFSMRGGGLHHVCFKCDDIDEKVSGLQHKGIRLISEPQPGEAFDNEAIAFMMDRFCLNFELIDTEKKAELLS